MVAGKRPQAVLIAVAEWLQVPQHQGSHRVTTRQFDLRACLTCIHAKNQLAQTRQQRADVGWQNTALLHVGHVTALALVKADQHLALLVHESHRQTGPVTVAPSRAFNGAQHGLGLDLAQMPQVVFKHTLFNSHLRTLVQVLHLAATTSARVQTKMRAPGLDPLRRLPVHRSQRSGFPIVFLAMHLGRDPFGGQGTVYKHNFAIRAPGNTLGVHVKGFNRKPALGQRGLVCCGHIGQGVESFFTHSPIVSGVAHSL